MGEPRPLTTEEKEILWAEIGPVFFPDDDITVLDDYWLGAFDYISDCPGYAGVLVFAVFGMPEFYYLWTLKDGKVSEVAHEPGRCGKKEVNNP